MLLSYNYVIYISNKTKRSKKKNHLETWIKMQKKINTFFSFLLSALFREAAKKSFFSGPALELSGHIFLGNFFLEL